MFEWFLGKGKGTFEWSLVRGIVGFGCKDKAMFFEVGTSAEGTEKGEHEWILIWTFIDYY
jgi:hypothetical protein